MVFLKFFFIIYSTATGANVLRTTYPLSLLTVALDRDDRFTSLHSFLGGVGRLNGAHRYRRSGVTSSASRRRILADFQRRDEKGARQTVHGLFGSADRTKKIKKETPEKKPFFFFFVSPIGPRIVDDRRPNTREFSTVFRSRGDNNGNRVP